LADAVQCVGISPPFAAAVNLQFVPKTQYASHVLQPNDQIELISPITGG
jgi:sulfur carrier protein